jgi:hypothetical protein
MSIHVPAARDRLCNVSSYCEVAGTGHCINEACDKNCRRKMMVFNDDEVQCRDLRSTALNTARSVATKWRSPPMTTKADVLAAREAYERVAANAAEQQYKCYLCLDTRWIYHVAQGRYYLGACPLCPSQEPTA